jgi:hypothetical protein
MEGHGVTGEDHERECLDERSWTRMPHGTARAPYVRLCGQFTTHTTRTVKKIENFFFIHFHPSFPPVHGRGPPSPKLFFLTKKII